MLLADTEIKKRITAGDLIIDPFDASLLQGASVDLTLSEDYLRVKDHSLTHISYQEAPNYVEIKTTQMVIPPHSFVLAATNQNLKIPNDLAGIVEGRSSIGRMGLFIQNAGLVTPGFQGSLTLELYNANNMPLVLKSGMRICQLLFIGLSSPTTMPYKGKYQHQKEVTGSRLFTENKSDSENPNTAKLLFGAPNLVQEPTLTYANSVNTNSTDQADESILLAADHAGFELKQALIDYLTDTKSPALDLGTFQTESSDYPEYGAKLAKQISSNKFARGILICGSGIGMSIVANRYPHIRAALCHDPEAAKLSRLHNNSNVLVLASRKINLMQATEIVKVWLETKFEAGRHARRVDQIDKQLLDD